MVIILKNDTYIGNFNIKLVGIGYNIIDYRFIMNFREKCPVTFLFIVSDVYIIHTVLKMVNSDVEIIFIE